jgi:hypothetical protein
VYAIKVIFLDLLCVFIFPKFILQLTGGWQIVQWPCQSQHMLPQSLEASHGERVCVFIKVSASIYVHIVFWKKKYTKNLLDKKNQQFGLVTWEKTWFNPTDLYSAAHRKKVYFRDDQL